MDLGKLRGNHPSIFQNTLRIRATKTSNLETGQVSRIFHEREQILVHPMIDVPFSPHPYPARFVSLG